MYMANPLKLLGRLKRDTMIHRDPFLFPRPQDLTGAAMESGMKTAWTGAKNYGRGIRGNAKARDFMTGETRNMSARERLSNDLRKQRKEIRAGYKMEYDQELGRHVPKMEYNEALGQNAPVRQGRVQGAIRLGYDTVMGNAAMAAGWGTKAAAVGTGYAALKSARVAGHATYQSAGLARDIAVNGVHDLHKWSQHRGAAWGLATAPIGIMVAANAYDTAEHYAVNKGVRGYEGQQLDGMWGSITGGGRFDLEAAGRSTRDGDVTRGEDQVMNTFNTGGDLVFSMHNRR